MSQEFHLSASQLIPVLEAMEDDVILHFTPDEFGGLMFVGKPISSGAIRISSVAYSLVQGTDHPKEALGKIYTFMRS